MNGKFANFLAATSESYPGGTKLAKKGENLHLLFEKVRTTTPPPRICFRIEMDEKAKVDKSPLQISNPKT